jgi:electron transport complex protein RnfB
VLPFIFLNTFIPFSLHPMLADRINQLLPQTQCTKCGYQGCKPYAQAIANDEVAINRCPPGGDAGIEKLAQLLELPLLKLDATCGEHVPLQVAVIEEQFCIGCTLCIQACPVDAILGANKFMHTVIASDCTGCDLCIAPCPVDCIKMVPVEPARLWTTADATQARLRYEVRQSRIAEMTATNIRNEAIVNSGTEHCVDADAPRPDTNISASEKADKQAAIAQALARARARRSAP